MDVIATSPLFQRFRPEALALLLDEVRTLDYSAGDIVIHEGTTGDVLYHIAEGQVVIVRHLGLTDETAIQTLGVGNHFGETCLLDAVSRFASVQAKTDTTLLALPRAAFDRLHHDFPEEFAELVLHIARTLFLRLRQLEERLHD